VVEEYLSSMHKTLGSIPAPWTHTANTEREKKEEEEEEDKEGEEEEEEEGGGRGGRGGGPLHAGSTEFLSPMCFVRRITKGSPEQSPLAF
jgi:hypothetical protein